MWEHPAKQRVTVPDLKRKRIQLGHDQCTPHDDANLTKYRALYTRFRAALTTLRNKRIGWSDVFGNFTPSQVRSIFLRIR
jgi:hypothetical protein